MTIAGGLMWPVPVLGQSKWLQPYLPEDAHITIMVFDEDPTLTDGAQFAKVLETARLTLPPIMLRVEILEMDFFGPDLDIPVLRVGHEYLFSARQILEEAMAVVGVSWNGQYEYQPHITLNGPLPGPVPIDSHVMTSTPGLWWYPETHMSLHQPF